MGARQSASGGARRRAVRRHRRRGLRRRQASLLRFGAVWVPPLILTLVIGMALQPLSAATVLKPGLEFAGRTLLRVGVALFGARLTLGQLVDDGALPVADRPRRRRLHHRLRRLGRALLRPQPRFRPADRLRHRRVRRRGGDGGLGGAAQARELRPRPRLHGDGRQLPQHRRDGALPALQPMLGYSLFEMGVFLGGAIHDVAQVAGAGQTMGARC